MEGVLFAILFVLSISLLSVSKAKDEATNKAAYIIWVNHTEGMHLEAFTIKMLSVVLGSMEAIDKAWKDTYNDLNGFAASLTPKQASEISKQPGVVQVKKADLYFLQQSPLSDLDAGLS